MHSAKAQKYCSQVETARNEWEEANDATVRTSTAQLIYEMDIKHVRLKSSHVSLKLPHFPVFDVAVRYSQYACN